jgi:hypothetical protein
MASNMAGSPLEGLGNFLADTISVGAKEIVLPAATLATELQIMVHAGCAMYANPTLGPNMPNIPQLPPF